LKIKYQTEQEVKDIYEHILKIADFFSLMLYMPVFPKNIVLLEDIYLYPCALLNMSYYLEDIEDRYTNDASLKKMVDSLPDNISNALYEWLKKYNEYELIAN